jgi:hypothetical protein
LNNLILQVDIAILTIGAIIASAIIGAIGGAFATYRFANMIENRREESERKKEIEFKKRLASIVSQELQTYHKFLDSQLVILSHVQSDDSRQVLEHRETFMNHLNGLSRDYINMPAEIKAKVFEIDTLAILGKVYQSIELFTPNLDANKFELSINILIHDIRLGSESIRNMIDKFKEDKERQANSQKAPKESQDKDKPKTNDAPTKS